MAATTPAKRRPPEPTWGDLGRELRMQRNVVLGSIALLWAIELVNFLSGHRLVAFGIHPRTSIGLAGILAAPFLHASVGHLFANTLVMIPLAWMVMVRENWHLPVVSIAVVLLGGLGVWLVGADQSVHVGASGLAFGWLGFLVTGGIFERRIRTILGSLVVLVLFGSLIWGVLPSTPGISWESHLFGFLAGMLMAWVLARRGTSGKAAASAARAR